MDSWGITHDPWDLMFMPLDKPLPLSMGKTYDLLLTPRIWQRWWGITPVVLLHYVRLCLASGLCWLWRRKLLWTLCWEKVNAIHSCTSKETHPSLVEPPDENQALADTLVAALWGREGKKPAKLCPGSWPKGVMRSYTCAVRSC